MLVQRISCQIWQLSPTRRRGHRREFALSQNSKSLPAGSNSSERAVTIRGIVTASISSRRFGRLKVSRGFDMERSEKTELDSPTPNELQFDCLANSLVQLLETAKRDLERDRETAKALLAKASSLLQSEIERRSGANGTGTGGLAGWQIAQVRAFIDNNLHRTIHIKDLSAVVRRSAAHFARSFKHTFGEPPHAYVMRRRFEKASHLMIASSEFFEPDRAECGIFGSITFLQTLQTSDWSKSIQLAARTRIIWHPLETAARNRSNSAPPNCRSAAGS